MTMVRQEMVPCPSCKKSQKVTLYDTINVDLNPDLRTKLFNGEINAFKCEHCGHAAHFADVALLYNDMKREFAVWYFPFSSLAQKEFYDDFSADGKLKLNDQLRKLYSMGGIKEYLSQTHIVFSMPEMIFYIIFREKLFDHCSAI